MTEPIEYKEIFIVLNPFGDAEYKYMVETPDVEFYTNSIADAKDGIDDWILENGSVEWYTKRHAKLTGSF